MKIRYQMPTYYVHPSRVYYLDPSSPDGLRCVEEPGRCNLYWHYVTSGNLDRAGVHLESCPDCRDWLDRCQEIVMSAAPLPAP